MTLNLARKWRSKTFDQMVGQELPVSMLKNSLYRNYFMPVYLFSGQRGCGKTSAARLFASAINCRALVQFQKDPKNNALPCGVCDSCNAMNTGTHPDFIEIDAASNTGVDNVRTVIESATLLPTLGLKRMYLIDEVHMLSKAAFNAFLKILEEPPATSLFILATTDLHKVLDTVRSRSFQIFFKSVPINTLAKHLEYICMQESINFESDALLKIAQYADGSVRDALNLLEQVRFAYEKIELSSVNTLLGILHDRDIGLLLQYAFCRQADEIRTYCSHMRLENYDASRVWYALGTLVRDCLFYMQAPQGAESERVELVKQLTQHTNARELLQIFELICNHELLFLRSRAPHHIIELVLCKIAMRSHTEIKTSNTQVPPTTKPSLMQRPDAPIPPKSNPPVLPETIVQPAQKNEPTVINSQWSSFITRIQTLDDPLLHSIFGHAHFSQYEKEKVCVSFPQNFTFFQDILNSTHDLWKPLLIEVFGENATLETDFVFVQQKNVHQVASVPTPAVQTPKPLPTNNRPVNANAHSTPFRQSLPKKNNGVFQKPIDVRDTTQWPKANLILSVFPGTIVEIQGDSSA